MTDQSKTKAPRKRVAFWEAPSATEVTARVPFRSLTQDAEARAAAEESWRRHLQRLTQFKGKA
jgi:hypothetical protein